MKNDLTCAVARDLMPSCADGLASEETNEALRRHTETCEACRAAFEKMKAPENTPATEKEKTEIAYLKKVNKKRLTVAVCAALAAALLVHLITNIRPLLIAFGIVPAEASAILSTDFKGAGHPEIGRAHV